MQTNKQKQKRSAISENPSGTRPDSNRMLLAGGQRENMIFILCECVNQVHHMSVPILIHAFLSSVLCRFLCELETEWRHANILAPLTQASRPDAIKKNTPLLVLDGACPDLNRILSRMDGDITRWKAVDGSHCANVLTRYTTRYTHTDLFYTVFFAPL